MKKLLDDTADQIIKEFTKTEPKRNRAAYDFRRNSLTNGVQLIFVPKDENNETSIYDAANELKTVVSKKFLLQVEAKNYLMQWQKQLENQKLISQESMQGKNLLMEE